MPTPSPRLKIPIYQEADTPVDIPAAWTARTTILDTLVPINSGLLPARPVSSPGTPGIVGRQQIVNGEADSPRLDLDLGNGWLTIGPPVRDGAPTVPSVRTLGNGANQACAGNDPRLFYPGDLKMSAAANPPTGWLLCDGSAVSRVTYVDLFNAIGTQYGGGDGSTTFALPDIRSRVPCGSGQGAGLTNRIRGATGGEELHSLSTAELPVHSHGISVSLSDPGHAHSIYDPGHWHGTGNRQDFPRGTGANVAARDVSWDGNVGSGSVGTGIGIYNNTTGMSASGSASNTGGGASHNVMQPFIVVNYFIKY